MRSPAALASLLVCALAGATASAQTTLVPAASEIVFTSRQMGVPVDGRFRRFDATLNFDPRAPEAARIALQIDLASVALGTAEIEAELRKPEWFGVAAFPQAAFVSRSVSAAGPGRFDVAGTLTIKGRTRELVVPVTLVRDGARGTATGSFTLKRLDFRIGDGDWNDPALVADEVTVRFRLALAGLP
jgi:polyisoprenoid-binding protein YceI